MLEIHVMANLPVHVHVSVVTYVISYLVISSHNLTEQQDSPTESQNMTRVSAIHFAPQFSKPGVYLLIWTADCMAWIITTDTTIITELLNFGCTALHSYFCMKMSLRFVHYDARNCAKWVLKRIKFMFELAWAKWARVTYTILIWCVTAGMM